MSKAPDFILKTTWAPQPNGVRASPTQLSVDPKGEYLCYGSGKSVFIRKIDDPAISRQYTEHTAPVNVARFSPSGYYIASGDAHGKVRVWDTVGEDMVTKGEFPIISGPIKDIAWDGESKRIIAVGEGRDRFGACISYDTGNSVGEITGHHGPINSVSMRLQRPFRAVTASDDHGLVFMHGAPFKYNKTLKDLHKGFVQAVAFSPDGAYFVSGGSDRKLFLFDGKTGDLISELTSDVHTGSVMALSWSPDSTRFVSASADQTVKLWDTATRTVTKTWRFGPAGKSFPAHQQLGVVWTPRPDGLILALSLNGDLNYILPGADTAHITDTGHQGPLTAFALSYPSAIFTGGPDGRVARWDPTTGEASIASGVVHAGRVTSILATERGAMSVGWDDHIRLLDDKATYTAAAATGSQPHALAAVSADATALVSETELRLFNGTDLKTSIALDFEPSRAIAASSTAGHIAVASRSNSKPAIRIYSTSTLSLLHTLPTRREASALSYDPSGKVLAVGEAGGALRLWGVDEEYKDLMLQWGFHTGRVEQISWNPEGTHIATAALDCGIAVLGRAKHFKKKGVRNAHQGGAVGVGWWGGRLVSAGADGAVKWWDVPELP